VREGCVGHCLPAVLPANHQERTVSHWSNDVGSLAEFLSSPAHGSLPVHSSVASDTLHIFPPTPLPVPAAAAAAVHGSYQTPVEKPQSKFTASARYIREHFTIQKRHTTNSIPTPSQARQFHILTTFW